MPAIRLERRWAVLAFCVVYSSFTYGLAAAGFTFWVGPWGRDFKVSHSLIMAIFSVSSLVLVLASPVIGRALDFISVRTTLVVGAVALAAGLAASALAPSFWLLFAIYVSIVPLGAACAGTFPATVLSVRLFPGRAGFINGLMGLSLSLGAVLMAGFAVPLIGVAGWRGTFLIGAALVLALIAPIGWFLLDVEAGAPSRTIKATATEGAVSAEGFAALRQPVFWMLLIAILPIMLALGAIGPNLAPIAGDAGVDPTRTALLVSIFSIAAATGALAGGWLADKIGPRLIYTVVLLTNALVLLLMAQRPGFMGMGVALGLFGLAGGTILPWAGAMVMRTFGGEGFARAFGLLTPFLLPATFAPILFGWIRDQTGGYQAGFYLFTVLLIPGALCLLMMRPAGKAAFVPAE